MENIYSVIGGKVSLCQLGALNRSHFVETEEINFHSVPALTIKLPKTTPSHTF